MALNLDLYMDQAADFLAVLPAITDNTGTVLDLTGYTVQSQMSRSASSSTSVVLTATIKSPATAGIISLALPAANTVGLSPTRYEYDVMITSLSGHVTKVFDGLIIVNSSITTGLKRPYLPYIPDDFDADPSLP